jgi:hypothetical protein
MLGHKKIIILFSKHKKSDRIVVQEARAFPSSKVGAYTEKEDGARNVKPKRRNLSLYLLSIWQAEQTSIFSEQGLESNKKSFNLFILMLLDL